MMDWTTKALQILLSLSILNFNELCHRRKVKFLAEFVELGILL